MGAAAPNPARRSIASRMDASIVGRRFIAGTRTTQQPGKSRQGRQRRGRFQTCPALKNPTKGGFQTRLYKHRVSRPDGTHHGLSFRRYPAMNCRATFSCPFGTVAEQSEYSIMPTEQALERHRKLIEEGWTRRFTADEPRSVGNEGALRIPGPGSSGDIRDARRGPGMRRLFRYAGIRGSVQNHLYPRQSRPGKGPVNGFVRLRAQPYFTRRQAGPCFCPSLIM